MVEMNCSHFASALMHLVYDFMEEANKLQGAKPPFSVPQMHYVNVALAIAKDEVYLLEEVIGGLEGKFQKYINNTSALMLLQNDENWQYIGSFLSFVQHVQLVETKKYVFISDLQGTVYLSNLLLVVLILFEQVGQQCCSILKSSHLHVFIVSPVF